ncbi:NRAMP family divalent metal transporter [Streptacidiphilus jiangxiensis]|uniref:NRAMP (Natural resistance-associated macrophage protein) metal ion transporters n=1 Tax=Streptacidiphilus jiangxiensis TaxID=235985 RepID=A0A1H7M1L4_STRJI|nr:divalent metal cation transporter [Streptacidiphilus jiangxiensis]SEL04979.1 NRAMP (natural resistance-associated macrophage protein) metal ion transporters [Streptacidiphilus jiangxiensis]
MTVETDRSRAEAAGATEGVGALPASRLARIPVLGRITRWNRWARLVALMGVAGPGLVAANAGNDAAGIATYASAGSQYVYGTLFFMVLVTVALVLVQEMAVRLGAFTGKGLGALIREQFSLRATGLALGCLLLANTGLVVSEFAGIGAGFELLGVPKWAIIPPAALLLWGLVLFGSYRYAERIFLVMSLVFFAYPIAMIMGKPNWGTVGKNLAIPHLSGDKDFILLAVALIGTTVSPYMQFYAASGVVDRGTRTIDYPLIRADAIIGAVFACCISLTIIIATATTIGGTGPLNSAADAAKALEPVAGQSAELLFALGLIGASALAGAVVPLSASYAIGEAAGVERSVSRSFRDAPFFLTLFTAQIALGAVVAMTPIDVIQLLIGTQVLQGLITPVVLVYLLILTNRRSLLGEHANKRGFRIAATVVVVGVATMSTVLLVDTVLGWFGLG